MSPWQSGWRTWPVSGSWRKGACSAWRRDGFRGPKSRLPIPTRRRLRRWSQERHSSGWWEARRQEMSIETREVQIGCKESHFPHEGSQEVKWDRSPERLCSHHPWRFSISDWINTWATCSDLIADPCLRKRLDYRAAEDPFQPALSDEIISETFPFSSPHWVTWRGFKVGWEERYDTGRN